MPGISDMHRTGSPLCEGKHPDFVAEKCYPYTMLPINSTFSWIVREFAIFLDIGMRKFSTRNHIF